MRDYVSNFACLLIFYCLNTCEQELKGDPAVGAMRNGTEEGKKVACFLKLPRLTTGILLNILNFFRLLVRADLSSSLCFDAELLRLR
jgi:hypothetical protein